MAQGSSRDSGGQKQPVRPACSRVEHTSLYEHTAWTPGAPSRRQGRMPSPHPRSLLTKIKSREPEHEEMLKMKIDPAMFLKTKKEDRISVVFVPENAQILQKFGVKTAYYRLGALF
jgi:hypothetical protein